MYPHLDSDDGGMGCVQAFETVSRGTDDGFYAERLKSRWKHVKGYPEPDNRCLHCGFLNFGYTDVDQLQLGMTAGRPCCRIVWEAVRAWHQRETVSPDGMHVLPWVWGYAGRGEELVGCSVLLNWPLEEHERLLWHSEKHPIINIFKSGPNIDTTDFVSNIPFMERFRPSGNTGSEQSINTIKSWMTSCNSSHHHYCTVNEEVRLPKRILELTEARFHLREGLGNEAIYACLSHCWGATGPSFMLTEDTVENLKAGMSSTELPRTFREAMEICLRLSIRYLWIDALCIIQQDIDDWKEAAATMADIYENAFLTIAATKSSDSEGGCFSRLTGLDQAKHLESSGLYASKRVKPYLPGTGYALMSREGPWPLLRRAWVFQERLLSPRVVHFTDYQLVWECRSVQQSETGDINDDWTKHDLPWDIDDSMPEMINYPFKFLHTETGNTWQTVVFEYSRLQLTHASDRLPAIAAIVQRTMRARKDDLYMAGMWESSLLVDSAWSRIKIQGDLERPDYTQPTWSWTSVPGAVSFYKVSVLPSTRLVDVQYRAVGPSHVGRFAEASILLRGMMLTVILKELRIAAGINGLETVSYEIIPNLPENYGPSVPRIGSFRPDFGLRLGKRPVKLDNVFVILILWFDPRIRRWFGLVLRRVSDTEHERIGMAHLYDLSSSRQHSSGSSSTQPRLATISEIMSSLPVEEFRIV
ncbi:hypothetical protein HBI56_128680 [Parastagonospora nodorum]|uniref:Heterokaryon incompatibility domain-containing protein n=1 Tax=Phaeosphaeria nodorum (strain SN15 / ATCC MYA-4574 / FGSC 10173) TaxID=321614 RepID=A0A7U2HZ07_PHANO|nr:hypothetical protein HBH56_155210 [Parastagonospora nodorum]QRC95878.1 hypothetical protein JI435_055210 [Parastagonospora nodorum SN15]KAH3926810.1 hypothetical protein HBH54_162480 [Parastagonospora nodorum]KAH4086484.1 hypothetical protein HBH46_205500 [Parastagonospora nodorum]KAH4116579.1 hypothetical protein HBH47_166020 [Parastagonospora nodorum]